MNRLLFALIAAIAAGTAIAEIRPNQRELQPVSDASMVVIDRGAKLEVFPTQRATPSLDSAGRTVMRQAATSNAGAPIDTQHLGVVFNHAMQTQGYISGEIAFQVKGGRAFTGSSSLYPGLKQITKPAVYVVNARTPAEFIKIMKRLQARSDLEWVEPTVLYAPPASPAKPAAP